VFLKIINYSFRILIICIGIVLISGLLPTFGNQNARMTKVFGGVFILYGIYRLVILRTRLKQQKGREDEND
jgi:uncharacterized protein YhhL (DUF1145 family)